MMKRILIFSIVASLLLFVGCSPSTAKKDESTYWEGYVSIAPGVVMVRDETNKVNCYLSIRGRYTTSSTIYPISCVKD